MVILQILKYCDTLAKQSLGTKSCFLLICFICTQQHFIIVNKTRQTRTDVTERCFDHGVELLSSLCPCETVKKTKNKGNVSIN